MQDPSQTQNYLSNDVATSARQSTNNDANLRAKPLNRLSINTAANTPLPQSPGLNTPRRPSELRRMPSSPGLTPGSICRSPSAASLNRSNSPALGRKSSSSSLRGDTPGTPRAPPSRRSSYNPSMPSPIGVKSPLPPPVEEKPPLRACDVAEKYFEKELAFHEGIGGSRNAGTIVIIHDQCYGHRYSRQKTSKGALSQIVERPERMLAIVLGISAAYVWLGDRHAEGANPPHPEHAPPERIPFKIRKTSRMVDLLSPAVTNVHGTKWMEELKEMCARAEHKLATTGRELAREHGSLIPGQPPKPEFHETDLYLCPESLNAFQGALGGVLDAVDAVFHGTNMGTGPSRAFVCVRPPGHHCSADYPSGFCWLNNVHVGIDHAMTQHGLTHAAIVDFDLHHGDGSQAITWERNKKVQGMHKNTPNWKKTSIGYFSIHDINSYPCENGDDDKIQAASLCMDAAHGQSIWNVHLEVWSTVEEFWKIYEEKYMRLLDKVRQYLKHHSKRLQTSPNHPKPKAAIFISAGFDASEWEGSGMQRHAVNVPTEFYARFTRDIVRIAEEDGTGVDGRVISVLEGGYSDRALASGALSHISGLTEGQIFQDSTPSRGLATDMYQRLAALSVSDDKVKEEPVDVELKPVSYNPAWWHESRLYELENLVNPAPVMPKKPARTGPPPNFSSPTQSFVAKVVDPAKVYRSVSTKYSSASPSRAPTPPPPDVDWATAAHGLSKLLIPSDRQTQSHRPEDLAEVKVKKEKPPPVLASVHVDPSGRQLRGRKPPTATDANTGSDEDKASSRAASRANRRRTIADFAIATSEPPAPTRKVSRRMSIASSVGSVNEDRSLSRSSSVVPGRRTVTPAPPTTNGVPVKKARGTVTAASRTTKNPPPVPRVPSNYLNKPAAPKEKENDMDQLTS
ncbi:Arginase/deacetylase, partial [Aaosphaeria arxii CBS 175.79]